MIYGLDTGFLVAAEVIEHPLHLAARGKLAELLAGGNTLALAPQVVAEFIHVVTDSKRFGNPLEMSVAIDLGERWWTAREVTPTFPNAATAQTFFLWMRQFGLGRKRLLDSLLAATFQDAGISHVLTTNPTDFAVFGCFQCVTP